MSFISVFFKETKKINIEKKHYNYLAPHTCMFFSFVKNFLHFKKCSFEEIKK